MTDYYFPGEKVTYVANGKREKGMVKRATLDGSGVFVVYNCNDDWSNFKNYTAAKTNFRDLIPGWDEDLMI